MRLGIRLAVSVVLVSLAIGGLAAGAEAVPTLTPGRTVPMASPALYTLAPDGTFWVVRSPAESQGTVSHLGAAGEVLSESSITQSYFDPLDIGYFGGQVYIASPSIFDNQLYAWPVGSIGKTPPTFADLETERHWGSVQFSFRINSAGIISASFGQEGKIGLFNGAAAFGEHPYYPWTVMGAGINNNYVPHATPFESCESLSGPVIGEPKVCGIYTGVPPSGQWGPNGLAYPDDIAPIAEGLYVSEYFGDEYGASISFVRLGVGGPEVEFRFGPPGSGAGGVDRPSSIVRDPAGGDLYVSEEGNRRIDVFDPAGNFLAAFGYGVHDGADTFESCTAETGCQAGLAYTADPHSLFTRLDFGPEGDLYAYEPLANQVQVFSLGGLSPIPPTPPLEPPPPPPGESPAAGGTLTAPIIKKTLPLLKCPKGKVLKRIKGVEKCVKKPKAHAHKHHHHVHHH